MVFAAKVQRQEMHRRAEQCLGHCLCINGYARLIYACPATLAEMAQAQILTNAANVWQQARTTAENRYATMVSFTCFKDSANSLEALNF